MPHTNPNPRRKIAAIGKGDLQHTIHPNLDDLSIHDFESLLQRQLSRPRNVREIWSAWAPELAYGRHLVPPPPDARPAAVFVLLYQHESRWQLPLIERIADATVHSGQISFPGGSLELNETPQGAARREFEEELGILKNSIRPCGELTSTYIFASNFVVTPCIALSAERPAFQPSPSEVASLIELPVQELMNPSRHGVQRIDRRGVVFEAPYIEFQGHFIWGATCMMLAELAAIISYDSGGSNAGETR